MCFLLSPSKYQPLYLGCVSLPGGRLCNLQNPVHMCRTCELLSKFLRQNSPGLRSCNLQCSFSLTVLWLSEYLSPPPELMNLTRLCQALCLPWALAGIVHRKGLICLLPKWRNGWGNQGRLFLQREGVCRRVRSHTQLICQKKGSSTCHPPCSVGLRKLFWWCFSSCLAATAFSSLIYSETFTLHQWGRSSTGSACAH